MAALSHFFSHLYTVTVVSLTLLLIEAMFLLRSAADAAFSSVASSSSSSSQQYLDLVEKKLPTLRYSRGEGKSPEAEDECAVCLSGLDEGAEIRELHCRHTFHRDCLDAWLQQDCDTCPLCRCAVLPEEAAARSRRRRRQDHPVEYDGSDEELMLLLSAVRGTNLHRWL